MPRQQPYPDTPISCLRCYDYGEIIDPFDHSKRTPCWYCLRRRHGLLVDKKFLTGLTETEANELTQINSQLDALDEEYYAPIKQALASAIPALVK